MDNIMADKYFTTNSINPTAANINTLQSGDNWRLKHVLSDYQCSSCTVMRDNVCVMCLEQAI